MPGSLSDTIRGLAEAAAELEQDAPSESELTTIIARGEFRPSEDEAIGFWFARYLSVRESLRAAIEEALELLDKPPNAIRQDPDLRYFLLGYAAACLLVRIDRLMLFRVADHSIIQRK